MLPYVYVIIALMYWMSWEVEFQTKTNPGKTRFQIFLVGLFWPLIVGFVIFYVLYLFLSDVTRG